MIVFYTGSNSSFALVDVFRAKPSVLRRHGAGLAINGLHTHRHSRPHKYCIHLVLYTSLRVCLQGGRVTLASGLTLAGRQKIAPVYKQNLTRRVAQSLLVNTNYDGKQINVINFMLSFSRNIHIQANWSDIPANQSDSQEIL